MEKQLNWKYATSQALNSGMLATMLVFASVYLLEKGFTSSAIGTILALSSVASIAIQTYFANYTDKNISVTLQDMLNRLLLIVVLTSIILLVRPSQILFLIAIVVTFAVTQSTVPFINSLAFIFEDYNIQINFGSGRGYASLAYALVTLAVGYTIEATHPDILPLFYIGFTLTLMLVLRSYQVPKDLKPFGEIGAESSSSETSVTPHDAIPVEQQTLKDFLTKYRELFYVIVGIGFAMFGQTMLSTFLIQIVQPIGGDSSTVGIAIFIGAMIEVPILMRFEWFLKKKTAAYWLKLAMLFYLLKVIIMFYASNIALIYVAQLLQAGSYALAYPATVHYIRTAIEKKDLFKGQTLFTIGTTLSSVFANLFGGLFLDYLGLKQMLFLALFVTFIGTALIYVVLLKVPNETPSVVVK